MTTSPKHVVGDQRVFLFQVMKFSAQLVATFIAFIGVLSVLAQVRTIYKQIIYSKKKGQKTYSILQPICHYTFIH